MTANKNLLIFTILISVLSLLFAVFTYTKYKGSATEIDTTKANPDINVTFDSQTGELQFSGEGLSGLSVDLDDRYLSSYTETDAIVGNEITDATTDKGLTKAGEGTTSDPYTLGINFSTNCSGTNQKLLYNGITGTWSCTSDIDTDSTYGSITDLDVPALTGNAGKVLAVNGTSTGLIWETITGGVTEDSLNFAQLQTALALDESTTVTFSTYDLILNLTDSGTFKIQDSGVDVLYVSASGKIGVNTTNPLGNMHIVGNVLISGDTHIECDGSASYEVGDCSGHTEGSALTMLVSADHVCANSATTPSAIRIDTDNDCTNNGGNDGAYILGKSTTTATTPITTWAYFDTNFSASYTDGEDLYQDNAPLLTYQSGNLSVDHITLTEPVWDDIRLSGSSLATGAAAPDQITWIAGSNLKVKGFDGTATTEMLYFELQFPHSYKEGTDIHPHIHWGPTNTNAGDVKWNLEYSWVNIGDTPPAPTTITLVQAAGGVAFAHKMVDFPIISGTNKTMSSMIVGRLYRNPTDVADTYASDAALLELDFHYQIDGLGSVSETSKE